MEEHSKSRTPTETALSVHREGQSKNWPSVGVGPEDHDAHLIAPGSQWPGGGLAGTRFGQEAKGRDPPPMQVERNRASLYQSGPWDTGQAFLSLRMGFPPCLSPQEAAGRVLRDRSEEMLLWPSLVIRPFNCNYFCN